MLAKTDEQIMAQGALSFQMIIERSSNPFKTQRERNLWDTGYRRADRKWFSVKSNKPILTEEERWQKRSRRRPMHT